MSRAQRDALAQALGQLQIAHGLLMLPNWQQHAAAIAQSVSGLSRLYLHIDAQTGVYEPAPIYLDPERIVLGLIPRVVEPLVRLLQRQTARLDQALAEGWSLPETEVPAWAHWHERLALYLSSLERALAKPDEPSEQLWREVTAPLVQGIYPANFGFFGIANPAVPSKPDATTVPTTAFMVALQSQEVSNLQIWLLRWREDIDAWLESIDDALSRYFRAAAGGVRRGARRALGIVVLSAALAGSAWVVTRALDPPAPALAPKQPQANKTSKAKNKGRKTA